MIKSHSESQHSTNDLKTAINKGKHPREETPDVDEDSGGNEEEEVNQVDDYDNNCFHIFPWLLGYQQPPDWSSGIGFHEPVLEEPYYAADIPIFHCLVYTTNYFYVNQSTWETCSERQLKTLSPISYKNFTLSNITVLAEVLSVGHAVAKNGTSMVLLHFRDLSGETSTIKFQNPQTSGTNRVLSKVGDDTVYFALTETGEIVEIKKGAVALLRSKVTLSKKDAQISLDSNGDFKVNSRIFINLEAVLDLTSANIVEHVEEMLRQYLSKREKDVVKQEEIEDFIKISRKTDVMRFFSHHARHLITPTHLNLSDDICKHYESISEPCNCYYEALLMCFVMEHWVRPHLFEDDDRNKNWIERIRPKITCRHAEIICHWYKDSTHAQHQQVYNCSCCPENFHTDFAPDPDAHVSERPHSTHASSSTS